MGGPILPEDVAHGVWRVSRGSGHGWAGQAGADRARPLQRMFVHPGVHRSSMRSVFGPNPRPSSLQPLHQSIPPPAPLLQQLEIGGHQLQRQILSQSFTSETVTTDPSPAKGRRVTP